MPFTSTRHTSRRLARDGRKQMRSAVDSINWMWEPEAQEGDMGQRDTGQSPQF